MPAALRYLRAAGVAIEPLCAKVGMDAAAVERDAVLLPLHVLRCFDEEAALASRDPSWASASRSRVRQGATG